MGGMGVGLGLNYDNLNTKYIQISFCEKNLPYGWSGEVEKEEKSLHQVVVLVLRFGICSFFLEFWFEKELVCLFLNSSFACSCCFFIFLVRF